MRAALSNLVDRLGDPELSKTEVIPWGCPVPSFGDLSRSTVATLGLNPSNREFVDERGKELDGASRRFHTLSSLGLPHWSGAETQHLHQIMELCRDYFFRNPYDRWFKRLDYLIEGTGSSYYSESSPACHLDLIPYATSCKWTDLTLQQRAILLELVGDTLGLILKDSPVRLLVLNGKTVVENLQRISGVQLESKVMADWTLPRQSGDGVQGIAYRGIVRSLGGVKLKRDIAVIGYNHNIQSSFGVTSEVQASIRKWIKQTTAKML